MDDMEPRQASDSLAALTREDLSLLSIEALTARLDSLHAEIARCQAMIESKKGSRAEAEAFFKS